MIGPGLHQLSSTRQLHSLVATLHLPSYHTRRAVLDLLYKSLNLQVNSDHTDLQQLELCQEYSFYKESGTN